MQECEKICNKSLPPVAVCHPPSRPRPPLIPTGNYCLSFSCIPFSFFMHIQAKLAYILSPTHFFNIFYTHFCNFPLF